MARWRSRSTPRAVETPRRRTPGTSCTSWSREAGSSSTARTGLRSDQDARLAARAAPDPRTPPSGGDLFVVVWGSGEFVNGPDRHPFGPGDALFVPAGVVHRFEDFTDDLVLWVVFYGPEGGEA